MKIIDQNVPSELFHDYQTSLRPMAQWQNNLFGTFKFGIRKFGLGSNVYVAQKRNPFRIPHMQGMGGNCPSAEQIAVRDAFKKCCTCFNEQPYTGGVTPPAIGPRNRSWWYAQAGPGGLWYYDYFIQQSWAKFFAGIPPDWCRFDELEDTYIAWGTCGDPNANYWYESRIQVLTRHDTWTHESGASGGLFKHKGGTSELNTLYVYIYGTNDCFKIYSIDPDSYNTKTVTWNTRPSLGALRGTFYGPGTGFVSIALPPKTAIAVIAYGDYECRNEFTGFVGGNWYSSEYNTPSSLRATLTP